MASWSEFAASSPALAVSVRGLLFQYGTGLGYLATVRPDGGPRVHPVSPAIVDGRLYCCLLRSPKRRDLYHDDRYALHAFPSDDSEDEAGLDGRAIRLGDPRVVRRISAAMRAEPQLDWALFELTVESAFYVHRRSAPVLGRDTHAADRWTDEVSRELCRAQAG